MGHLSDLNKFPLRCSGNANHTDYLEVFDPFITRNLLSSEKHSVLRVQMIPCASIGEEFFFKEKLSFLKTDPTLGMKSLMW